LAQGFVDQLLVGREREQVAFLAQKEQSFQSF
jgi:hypothetical protein